VKNNKTGGEEDPSGRNLPHGKYSARTGIGLGRTDAVLDSFVKRFSRRRGAAGPIVTAEPIRGLDNSDLKRPSKKVHTPLLIGSSKKPEGANGASPQGRKVSRPARTGLNRPVRKDEPRTGAVSYLTKQGEGPPGRRRVRRRRNRRSEGKV